MIIADVHAHLDFFKDDEIERIIEESMKEGVKAILTHGVDIKSNRKSLEIARKYPLVKPVLGIYPDEVLKLTDAEIEAEISFIREHKDKVMAIGEIGLDYKGEKSDDDKRRQKDAFLKLIALAKKLKVPVVVHSRNAEKDCIDILEESKHDKVVMHCFGGNHKLVERIRQNRWHMSIPCSIVRSEHFQKLVKDTPIRQLLTETDSPFLSPYREKQNQPSYIKETILKIAQIKGLDPEETAMMLYQNYLDTFC